MIYVVGVVAIGMVLMGRWGFGKAEELVPGYVEPELREKQVRVNRRGAVVLQIVGVVLFLFSACAAVYQLSHL